MSNFLQDNIIQRFTSFISKEVPRKLTNVLWQLFNGTISILDYLDMKINFFIRERNLLTATQKTSLRSLASMNGFEPQLKTPATGLLRLEINQKLYSTNGFPLFLPPYSSFICRDNGLKYYFNSDKTLRLVGNIYDIPVVEGELKTDMFQGTGEYIQRIYIKETNIAENSMTIFADGNQLVEVKSFFDNTNFNDNLQFVVKHSNNLQDPIVVYIKGVEDGQVLNVTYRLTFGELGNINSRFTFDTEDIITANSDSVETSEETFQSYNVSGFLYGSNGTDENSLRASLGYNHGSLLLFDNISYRNFINKFSTLLLQDIVVNETQRSINNIYLSKKQVLIDDTITDPAMINRSISREYQEVIQRQLYLLNSDDKDQLDQILSKYEFALSTHNIYNSNISKFALQIKFNSLEDKEAHQDTLEKITYFEFAKFLFNKFNSLDIEQLLRNYMVRFRVEFEFYIFTDKIDSIDNGVILHSKYLPILKGDFTIKDGVNLFTDINFVIRDN
jgi:hypothetical protein